MCRPTLVDEPISGRKSGILASSTGVGTATMMTSASARQAGSLWYSAWTAARTSSSLSSREGSVPARHFSTLSTAMSKPIVRPCLPNSTTSGSPTYPNPTTAITDTVFSCSGVAL